MPGIIRKLIIYAIHEGLVLQPQNLSEPQTPILIDYKTKKPSAWLGAKADEVRHGVRIDAHGIVGIITIASLSFLIAVTGREQVAQAYGKPIYTITDVAILPLSSKSEAHESIVAALQSKADGDGYSESDCSDSENESHTIVGNDIPSSPGEDERPSKHRTQGSINIAENVAKRKVSYGKFASQWFSKQGWTSAKAQAHAALTPTADNSEAGFTSSSADGSSGEPLAATINKESHQHTSSQQPLTQVTGIGYASSLSLLPKILRTTKIILSSRSFYFSYDMDLTRRLELQASRAQALTWHNMEPTYLWNRKMGITFAENSKESFLLPIIQGFVGQRTFSLKSKRQKPTQTEEQAKDLAEYYDTEVSKAQQGDNGASYLLTLISRRSVKRSGLRYLRRGIDDEGNCANFVETEQILSKPDWNRQSVIRSFVQLRGSIPLYFSQSPYSFKPIPILQNSRVANKAAFQRHFGALEDRYGAVQIAVLVDKHGTEVAIGNAYENMYKELREQDQLANVDFEWFDFHAECRGMKFENVERLVTNLKANVSGWGETVVMDNNVLTKQDGVVRTNCMDCLDRTNVAQSAFGQYMLQRDLEADGYEIDLLHDESTNWFNTLWADNGDAISRQYASTAALKGDFTRTRKRDWRGQVNDLGLTLSRYYSNMVNDYFSQAVIDVLLGNVSWRVFEDFENTMMSADPGISIGSIREAAIDKCAKIAIQDKDEDLIHGWTMLTPAYENTLRTLPFEETVVLLTDVAIYCCKFDWNTGKIASFEKVDLRSILKVRVGTYITSTFTDRQLDEELNQGLVILFTPGQGGIIRVNTRSLQNSVSPGTEDNSRLDGGTGILSWFAPRTQTASRRTLALKVIPSDMTSDLEADGQRRSTEAPRVTALNICNEIKRAITVPDNNQLDPEFIEEGDIINAADARKRTGYLEQLSHSIKKFVWA